MKFPYGISDLAVIRKEKYLYVDKTKYIEQLEIIGRYLFFIRPRRFGKSLFLSTLEHYYDLNQAREFAELFGDLYIGKQPTTGKNSYFILKLNFSGLNTYSERELRDSFMNAILHRVLRFVQYYQNHLIGADEVLADLKEASEPREVMDILYNAVARTDRKIYLIIDEYDHFANDIIAMGDGEYYRNVVQARGFVRDFYETVKIGTEGVIDRIFMTGISPIMLDDITSGFNISSNITTLPMTNEMFGFTEDEVKRIIADFGVTEDQDVLLGKLKTYYNGYLFNVKAKQRVYNPDMIMYFFDQWRLTGSYPEKLIDDNVKTDYGRLSRLLTNPDNRDVLLSIIKNEQITAEIVSKFSFERMYDQRYFVSLLFYLGMLTITGTRYGMTELGIPNFVIKTVYWEYIGERLKEDYKLVYDTVELQKAVWQMAYEGEIQPYLQFISEKVLNVLSNRDLIGFDEKYIKVILFSFLLPSSLYKPTSEKEVEGGYIDIFLEKDIRFPDVKYEWVWELKYLKTGEENLERVEEEGLAQLHRYAESEKFRGRRNIKKALIIFIGKSKFKYVVEKIN